MYGKIHIQNAEPYKMFFSHFLIKFIYIYYSKNKNNKDALNL